MSLDRSKCYTFKVSETSLPFLNVLVKLDINTIKTDLYSKPTHFHNYLSFYHSHSKHININIPYNIASRYVAIICDMGILNQRLKELSILTFPLL